MANGDSIKADDIKRKNVSDTVFETTLSIEHCRRILKSSNAHEVNFRETSGRAQRQRRNS